MTKQGLSQNTYVHISVSISISGYVTEDLYILWDSLCFYTYEAKMSTEKYIYTKNYWILKPEK